MTSEDFSDAVYVLIEWSRQLDEEVLIAWTDDLQTAQLWRVESKFRFVTLVPRMKP